jgi:hypothetical protein
MPTRLGNPVTVKSGCVNNLALQDSFAIARDESPTSNSFVFSRSSSSLSLRRFPKMAFSLSNVSRRRPSRLLFLRSFSASMFRRFNWSCKSVRDRCASDKSARVVFNRSVNDGPGSDEDCLFGTVPGEGEPDC